MFIVLVPHLRSTGSDDDSERIFDGGGLQQVLRKRMDKDSMNAMKHALFGVLCVVSLMAVMTSLGLIVVLVVTKCREGRRKVKMLV